MSKDRLVVARLISEDAYARMVVSPDEKIQGDHILRVIEPGDTVFHDVNTGDLATYNPDAPQTMQAPRARGIIPVDWTTEQ
ncbi:MAG TPA: hypothetical protein VJL83_00455 [Patescibacteria group bacterium]|nr:hypothetical protein [Patescibacteria group bacterium]